MQNNTNVATAKKVVAGFVSLILGRATTIIWGQHVSMLANGDITLPTPTTGEESQIAALTRMAVHEAGHALHTDVGCFDRLSNEQQWVFNLLEDPRMEKQQRKLFPGAGVILARGFDDALDTILNGIDLQREEDRAKVLQLDVIIRGMRALSPYAAIEERAQAFEALAAQVVSEHQRMVIEAAIAELATHTSSIETEDLAVRLERQLREQPPEEQMPPEDGGDQDQDQESEQQNQGEAQEDQESGEHGQAPEPSSELQQGDDGEGEGADDNNDAPGEDGQSAAGTPQAEGKTTEAQDGEGSEQPDSGEGASGPEPACGPKASGGSSGSHEGEAPGQPATEASDPVGESEPAGDNPNGEAGEGGECCAQPEADLDAKQEQQPLTLPKSSYDLGDMLREAYEAQHGKITEPQQQMQEETRVDEQTLRLLAEAIADVGEDGQDLEELVQVAIQHLERTDVAKQSGVANGTPGATVLAAAVPLGVGPDVRLDGVQSRLVRVLLRELQDKRRRPTSYARAGGQVAVNRFWRLNSLGDTKVFRVKAKRNGVDAAVKVLLDRSGSMAKVLPTAAEATLAFSLAMQRLGNVSTSVAMFPAQTDITESLQTFGQPAQQAVRRCANLVATGGTPLGAAVARELPDLLRQKKEKHVLVVVTDDGPDDPHLLARALEEAYENDVEVIGVGIGCCIRAFIPNSTSISCTEQLPDAMEGLFREKLALRLAA
ncbi:VWA domain-containing protein [Hydrogenophaga sp. BPS33]|uniref:VWA domain-containing protein n=1 Tax=Hydrogenophaga sp. BPS33 TaxID=2651974 RepID=UPI00131FED33|nr:VWA domain-containing protein [Hydrogenophaga sp. BPS33]QHE89361.1 VWA domain-containing protein [Hydrogenophaga sp. BPS33]